MATATKQDETAKEYEARAKRDFDPNETVRERADRLRVEAAKAEAEALAQEQKQAAESVMGLVKQLQEAFAAQEPGKVCRNFTVRFQMPGDEFPEVVKKLEQSKPGVVVKFRNVKPRAEKKSE